MFRTKCSSSERSTLTCLLNIYRTNAGKIRYPERDSNPRHPDLMKGALTTELPIMRWLRVILRLDRYRVEESMKFGTKNLVGMRNKFSLGAT